MSYDEIMDRACPDYLAMGMTYDEYWNGDPEAAIFYRKAHALKRKETNYTLWLQGLYIYEAIGDLSPVLNGFVKNPKPAPYPKEPYALTQEEFEERKKREEIERDKEIQAKVRAWAARVNRIKTKKGAQDG